jgi:hypothetical protein
VSLTGILRAIKGIFEWRNFRTGMLTTNFAEAGGFVKSQPGEAIPTCSSTLSSASWWTMVASRPLAMATRAMCACCAPVESGQRHTGQHRPDAGRR